MARYGKKAGKKVKRAMHERKRGTLRSGRSGRKVKSRKQAIAIGLSEARRSGAKVPAKRSRKKKYRRGAGYASARRCANCFLAGQCDVNGRFSPGPQAGSLR